jgi:hypothetical protein
MLYYNPFAMKKILHKQREDYGLFHINRAASPKFDRTGLFTRFDISEKYNFRSMFDMPDFSKPYTKNFEDTAMATAQKIVETPGPFNLFWSGGLDSTMVLVCLDQWRDQIKDRIKIIMTDASIADNPHGYANIIKPHYQHVVCEDFGGAQDHYSLDHMNVTGDCSEVIYGWSGIVQAFMRELGVEGLYVKLEDIPKLKSRVSAKNYETFEYYLKLYRVIEETLPACPIEIVDIQDLNWWFVFNFCYQFDLLRFMVPYYKNYKKCWDNMNGFFSSEDWQLWIVNNYGPTMKGITDFKYMKKDEINLIAKYHPEIDLSATLPRKTNVHLKYLAPTNFLMIDDDYNLVDCPDYLKTTQAEILSGYRTKSMEEIQMLFD